MGGKLELSFKIASKNDAKIIASFISIHNSNIQQQSLQCSNTSDDILADLNQYFSDDEAWFCMAFNANKLVGILGGDCDVERERLWIWGPYAEVEIWNEIAEQLYNESLKHWSNAKNFTAYINNNGSLTKNFFLNKGFNATSLNHSFALKDNVQIVNSNFEAIPFTENLRFVLESKQNKFFPNTYFTPQELIERSNKNFKILFVKLEDNYVAYIVGEKQPSNEGYIHFLGVDEAYRRKGIAQFLVSALSNQFLIEDKVKKVHLTVKDNNEPAKALYAKLGFTNQVSGVGLIKQFD